MGATVKDGFRGALNKQTLSSAITNKNGHGLSVARELVGGEPLSSILVVSAGVVQKLFGGCVALGYIVSGVSGPDLLNQDSQSAFGRFANIVVGTFLDIICELSIVTECRNLGQLCDSGRGGGGILDWLSVERDGAFRGEAATLDGQFIQARSGFIDEDDLVDAHLVGRKCTCLVRTYDATAT